jgi:hypothetical protein
MTIATELSPALTPSKDDNWPNEPGFEAPPQLLDPADWPKIDHLHELNLNYVIIIN